MLWGPLSRVREWMKWPLPGALGRVCGVGRPVSPTPLHCRDSSAAGPGALGLFLLAQPALPGERAGSPAAGFPERFRVASSESSPVPRGQSAGKRAPRVGDGEAEQILSLSGSA